MKSKAPKVKSENGRCGTLPAVASSLCRHRALTALRLPFGQSCGLSVSTSFRLARALVVRRAFAGLPVDPQRLSERSSAPSSPHRHSVAAALFVVVVGGRARLLSSPFLRHSRCAHAASRFFLLSLPDGCGRWAPNRAAFGRGKRGAHPRPPLFGSFFEVGLRCGAFASVSFPVVRTVQN